EDKREVRRSETGIFRQVSPGLALLLLGETDEEGFPTATRTLITAAYPAEQELGRAGGPTGLVAEPIIPLTSITLPSPTSNPFRLAGIELQIIDVTTQTGYITTRFRLYNGGSMAIPITPEDIWITLGYVENALGPRMLAEGLKPFTLLPGQATDLSLFWPRSG